MESKYCRFRVFIQILYLLINDELIPLGQERITSTEKLKIMVQIRGFPSLDPIKSFCGHLHIRTECIHWIMTTATSLVNDVA